MLCVFTNSSELFLIKYDILHGIRNSYDLTVHGEGRIKISVFNFYNFARCHHEAKDYLSL